MNNEDKLDRIINNVDFDDIVKEDVLWLIEQVKKLQEKQRKEKQ